MVGLIVRQKASFNVISVWFRLVDGQEHTDGWSLLATFALQTRGIVCSLVWGTYLIASAQRRATRNEPV